MTSRCV